MLEDMLFLDRWKPPAFLTRHLGCKAFEFAIRSFKENANNRINRPLALAIVQCSGLEPIDWFYSIRTTHDLL